MEKELLPELYRTLGADKADASAWCSITLIALSVLLTALGTSLFAMGDVRGEDCAAAKDRCVDAAPSGQPETNCPEAATGRPSHTQAPLFQVNPRGEKDLRHEKRFYRDGRLCGAVLMGDLSKMIAIKEELSS